MNHHPLLKPLPKKQPRLPKTAVCGLLAFLLGPSFPVQSQGPDPLPPPPDLTGSTPPAGLKSTTRLQAVPLSLELAYARSTATDQAIRIAYLRLKRAQLLPWSALTRMEPKMATSIGRGKSDEDRNSASMSRESQIRSGTGSSLERSVDTLGRPRSGTETYAFEEERIERERVPLTTLDRSQRTQSMNVVLEQPLLDLTVFPAWKFGKLATEAARLQCRAVTRDVLLGVARCYYDALKADASLQLARETRALASQQLEQAQGRLDAGEALRTDLLRAKAQVESTQRAEIEALAASRLARASLATLLNLDPALNLVLAEPTPCPDPDGSLETHLQRAFARRDDYTVRSHLIEQQRLKEKEAAFGYLPRVSAQFRAQSVDQDGSAVSSGNGRFSRDTQNGTTGTFTDTSIANGFRSGPFSNSESEFFRQNTANRSSTRSSQTTTGWEALLTFEMPLWGQRTVDLRKASYDTAIARLEQEQAAKNLREEVRLAWIQVSTTRQAVETLRAEVDAAEQTQRDLKAQYTAGSATSLEIQQAIRDLNSARSALLSRSFDLQIALRELQRATGDFQAERISNLQFR